MKVKFKGLIGEDLVVRIVERGDHNHLEVYYNGSMLWYAHLMKDAISLWNGKFYKPHQRPDQTVDNVYLKLGGDE